MVSNQEKWKNNDDPSLPDQAILSIAWESWALSSFWVSDKWQSIHLGVKKRRARSGHTRRMVIFGAQGLINLSRGRMRLLLEKSENAVLEFVLSRFSRPFFVLNSLLARLKSRPLLHCLDAEDILLIGLFESVEDLCFRCLAKTIMSDCGPLLQH
jgi:hypothetical protein